VNEEPNWGVHFEWESEFSFRTEGIPDWDRIILEVSRTGDILTIHELVVLVPRSKQKDALTTS